jgi:outer membrane protein assembly factor BamB
LTASVAAGDERVEVRRLSSSGEEIWTCDLPAEGANAVALLHADDRVYAALYTNGATGSRVVALDAEKGERLWERRAERAAAGHSKYSNVVSLSSRPGVVVVSGRESAGEFREELDAATGRPISHEARS